MTQSNHSAGAACACDDQQAVRQLIALLFSQPQRVSVAYNHTLGDRFYIAPHKHEDLLQLDLIDGCRGSTLIDGQWQRVAGLSALASYPGDEHGYELVPASAGAIVYHLKIEADGGWPVVAARLLPRLVTQLDARRELVPPFKLLTHSTAQSRAQSPETLARLAEVLALWPRRGAPAGALGADLNGRSDDAIEALDPDLAEALRMIHRRPDDPPSLDDMAARAHLSPRQFSRRFQQLLGCTPHAYVTSRRFEQARQMLLQDRLRIHEIARRVGFSSSATFSRWFTQQAGMSPQAFRLDPARL